MNLNAKPKIFLRFYKTIACVCLNTIVFLLVLDFSVKTAYQVKDKYFAPRQFYPELSSKFNPDGTAVKNGKRTFVHDAFFDRNAYGITHTDQEIGEILDEMHDYWHLPKAYLGMGIIELATYKGKHLNVIPDKMGVNLRWTPAISRSSNNKTIKIFALGGSTTFGNLIGDNDTWPSHLDLMLNKNLSQPKYSVFNYGRPGADVFDELALLLTLIQFGHKPDIVIFLDGLNGSRSYNHNNFGQADIKKLIDQSFKPIRAQFSDLPLIRDSGLYHLSQSLKRQLAPESDEAIITLEKPPLPEPPSVVGAKMAQSYLLNKNTILGITEKLGIKTLFFLQPDVLYNYPHHLLRNPLPTFYTEERKQIKTEFYRAIKSQTDSIDLLDLFSRWGDKKAIVDDCHYSPEFSAFIAMHMVPHIAKSLKNSPKRNPLVTRNSSQNQQSLTFKDTEIYNQAIR